MRSDVAFITTCRERLEHVKQSSKLLMDQPRVRGHWYFVDSFCPEGSGDWVEEQFGAAVNVLRLAELREDESEGVLPFNKPLALNTGAYHAIQDGHHHLVFIDADTLVTPELISFVYDNLSPDSWQMFEPGKRDLSGFLVTHHKPFVKVGGYDRQFEGWGCEDLDLRIRLYCYPRRSKAQLLRGGGRRWTTIPNSLASGIQHSDALRGKHYAETNIRLTNALNMNQLCLNVCKNAGLHPADLHGTQFGDDLRLLLDMT